VAGPAPRVTLRPTAGAAGDPRRARKGTRRAWFAEVDGYVETPVYDRYALAPGARLAGPAIVEERESTAVIGPGGRCRIDDGLALVVEP
jgi:N-methylhydantoinase A